MRGLMADRLNRIIDVPVRSNFREGMTVLEYFISTHGARKASPTPRCAPPTRVPHPAPGGRGPGRHHARGRLRHGGGLDHPLRVERREGRLPAPAVGRLAAAPLPDLRVKLKKGEEPPLLIERNEIITEELAARIDEAGIDEVLVRSPLTCEARYGVCRACYGRNLATGEMVGSVRRSASSPPSRSASPARS